MEHRLFALRAMGLWFVAAAFWAAFSQAEEPLLPDGTEAAEKAMAALTVPEGLRIRLFAAEPQLASPVAICVDEKNRVFVAEEHRFNRGTEENRTRPFLLEDDLRIQTVSDRLAMYEKWADKFDGGMDWFRRHSDQVRLLVDSDGDGRADRATVFAGGFNDPLDGLASGVLAQDGNVYFTCIPHLWRLRDHDGDGVADERTSLQFGFGVNCAFLGHDLHGLVFGPDGKLYFSVGDRGFHLETKEGRTLHGPRTGAVFRCMPDGSEMEVVARGLRNPQELAFDEFGNLFAADNNCDKGDHSRLVYVVEGGDSGWNMAYQTIPEPYLTGPWHAEKMWHVSAEEQPNWIVPPIAPLGAGPSGLAYYPGTGLGEAYQGRFFHCNFTGNGGVETFGMEPQGAGFTKIDHKMFLNVRQATDVTFGYDGRVYVSDFIGLDWTGASRGGRIYTLEDPAIRSSDVVQQVERIFAEGFENRSIDQLAAWLSHPDMRLRQRAQFALAARGEPAAQVLMDAATQTQSRLARLHGLWGLGQMARTRPDVLRSVLQFLEDDDAEVRAQTARILGDAKMTVAADRLIPLLADESPRVRFFAAQSLGKLSHQPAGPQIMNLFPGHKDPFLRHAGVMALVRLGDLKLLQAHEQHSEPAVRMAVLLAYRKLEHPRVAEFLHDADMAIVTEAARVVHDLEFSSAMERLADLSTRYQITPLTAPDAFWRRIISANYRLGEAKHAERVTHLAANAQLPAHLRQEAIACLRDWSTPGPRDRVNGFWRPLSNRDPELARAAVRPLVAGLLADSAVQESALALAGELQLEIDNSTFVAWIEDNSKPDSARSAALQLLAARDATELPQALAQALESDRPRLRASARDVLMHHDPKRGLTAIGAVLQNDNAAVVERQAALASLSRSEDPSADTLLAEWTQRLLKRDVPIELRLDCMEAALQSGNEQLARQAETYARSLSGQPHGVFADAVRGGDAERGREIFVGHARAQCVRCHKVGDLGGDAGPALSDLTKRFPEHLREHVLEAIVDPNAKIAPGFGQVTLVLEDGKVLAGTLAGETKTTIQLKLPDGPVRTIERESIVDSTDPLSPMPQVRDVLTVREVRDLVEYLVTFSETADHSPADAEARE